MAHLSNPRIDFRANLALDWGMRCILVLPLFALTACASFPQVDAAASKTLGPRPALLTVGKIDTLTAQNGGFAQDPAAQSNDLPARAAALRSR